MSVRREGLFIANLILLTLLPPLASASSAGVVYYVKTANPGFDSYDGSPTAAQEQWMNTNFWRMVTWSSYFDSRTAWYPNAWVYQDSYAIYPGSTANPAWILKDTSGSSIYINYACSGGTCSQYAADVSNPAFQQWWISQMQAMLARGNYKGLFIDDVNMFWDFTNGDGNSDPNVVDPNTGQVLTIDNWQKYMATFLGVIRTTFPTYEITHNAVWSLDYNNVANGNGTTNQYIQQEIQAANYLMVEFGVEDGGITGGTGQFSLSSLMNYADWAHSLGTGLLLSGDSTASPDQEYDIAGYFLISSGIDSTGDAGAGFNWTNWWPGLNTNLGTPAGARYKWNNLWRRDFSGGMVLLDEPGAATVTVTLPGTYQRTDGSLVTSVTLSARQGAILVNASASVCDVNGDGTVNILDVQQEVNAALGEIPCISTYDINGMTSGGSDVCSILDVQIVVNASLTRQCIP